MLAQGPPQEPAHDGNSRHFTANQIWMLPSPSLRLPLAISLNTACSYKYELPFLAVQACLNTGRTTDMR